MPALSGRAPRRAGGGAVLCWLLGSFLLSIPRPLVAQASASLDVGASALRYDQFRTTWGVAAAPSLRLDYGPASLVGRGSVLQFASGHRDLHGSLIATTLTPALGALRGELTVDGGASRYLSFPTFSHLFAGAHIHLAGARQGVWVGTSLGRTSIGAGPRAATTIDLGLWASLPLATITFTTQHNAIGDTTYTDFEGTARVRPGGIEVDGVLGARAWSHGAGRGLYGDVSATIPLARYMGLVIGFGRDATDPTQGTIAVRYLTVGIQLSSSPLRPVSRGYAATQGIRMPGDASETDASDGPTLEIGKSRRDGRLIRVHAEGAESVDLMGDFTDWQPVSLTHVRADAWEIVMILTPGPHYAEIRINGGPWRGPARMVDPPDDFGGQTGLLLVPNSNE